MFVVIFDHKDAVGYATEKEARQAYEAHLAKGHPAVRSASVHEGPDVAMVRRVVIEGWEPVRFIRAGIPGNYYDSDEWKRQQETRHAQRLARGEWDCGCGEECEEDMAYCPNCGREAPAETVA